MIWKLAQEYELHSRFYALLSNHLYTKLERYACTQIKSVMRVAMNETTKTQTRENGGKSRKGGEEIKQCTKRIVNLILLSGCVFK